MAPDTDALARSMAELTDELALFRRSLQHVTSRSLQPDAHSLGQALPAMAKLYGRYRDPAARGPPPEAGPARLLARLRRVGHHCQSIRRQAAPLAAAGDARVARAWRHAGDLYGLAEACAARVVGVLRFVEGRYGAAPAPDEGLARRLERKAALAAFAEERRYHLWRARRLRPQGPGKRKQAETEGEEGGEAGRPGKLQKADGPGGRARGGAADGTGDAAAATGGVPPPARTGPRQPPAPSPSRPASEAGKAAPAADTTGTGPPPPGPPSKPAAGAWRDTYASLLGACAANDPGASPEVLDALAELAHGLLARGHVALSSEAAARAGSGRRADELREEARRLAGGGDGAGGETAGRGRERELELELEGLAEESMRAREGGGQEGGQEGKRDERWLGFASAALARAALAEVAELDSQLQHLKAWAPKAARFYRDGGDFLSRGQRIAVV